MTRNTAQTSAPATKPAAAVTGIRVRSRVQAGVRACFDIMCCPAA